MSSARNLSSEEKLALLRQIQEAYGKCKEFGDDKVQLAMQTYEMVWPCSWLPTTSHLIFGVLDPSFSCQNLFWIWEIHGFCLSLFFFNKNQAYISPFSFLLSQVDKHIRRLDTDLARFEADLKEKQIESSDYDSSSSKGKKSEEGGGAVRVGKDSEGEEICSSPRREEYQVSKKRKKEDLTHLSISLPSGFPPLP